MAIDPESIERFLAAVPFRPQFKGMPESELLQRIQEVTGTRLGATKLPLRPYQLEGLASALWSPGSFLFFGVRLGKTKIALDWATHLRRAGLVRGKGLVIAHAPIGLQVWEKEAAKHSYFDVRTIPAGEGVTEHLMEALGSNCDLIVMAWSVIQQVFSHKKLNRKGVPKLYPDHETLRLVSEFFSHAIIDETHLCQNHTSLRFNIGVDLLERCTHRLGLTGTPMGRDPYAIWAQAFLLDNGDLFGRSYYFFEQAFGKKVYNHFARRKEDWVFDKKKSDIFKQKLGAMSLAYERKELQEENVIASVVELDMAVEQRKAYNDIVDKFVRLDPTATVEVRATFVRMRQVASGYLPFTGPDGEAHVMKFKQAPKLEWLRAFLEECPQSLQCVIFHEFTPSGEMICKLLTELKLSHAWLYGGNTDAERRAAVSNFQSGKVQILVSNSASGGTGIDLPTADYLLFYESPVSPITREQAAGRPLARGSRALIMDDLICAPVEAKILGFIAEGKDMMASLVHACDKASLRAK